MRGLAVCIDDLFALFAKLFPFQVELSSYRVLGCHKVLIEKLGMEDLAIGMRRQVGIADWMLNTRKPSSLSIFSQPMPGLLDTQ